jgi:serine/threonine protein kinase
VRTQEFRKRRKNETEKEYVKKLTAEFCISSTLHNQNIVETVDLVQDEQQRWCEVMEYCPGGDLYAAIKRGGMSTSERECCFKQILSGIEYLHGQGVAHRDIKPENLFFDGKGFLKVSRRFFPIGFISKVSHRSETTVHLLCIVFLGRLQFTCRLVCVVVNLTLPRNSSQANVRALAKFSFLSAYGVT